MNQKYRETGYRVDARTVDEIRYAAHELIDIMQRRWAISVTPLDVVRFIETLGKIRGDGELDSPDYRIVADSDLPGRAAEFKPRANGQCPLEDDDLHGFVFSQTVWDLACAGDPEARETFAHEIGHWMLKHPAPTFARFYHDDIVEQRTDSEWQANVFMDEVLMDSRLITDLATVVQLVQQFGVTTEAALRRKRRL